MIECGNVPTGTKGYIYWPQVGSSAVLSLADSLYTTHQLSASDAYTISCSSNGGLTFIPIPPSNSDQFFAGLFTVDLPLGVTQGQQFTVTLRRISYTRAPTERDAVRILNPIRSRYIADSVLLRIPVSTPATLLQPEETTLAIMKWRLQNWSPRNRWYPVLLRYLSYLAGRVDGLGGNSGAVAPSPPGAWAGVKPPSPGKPVPPPPGVYGEYTGKVAGIVYDRFGDFHGFLVRTESGEEKQFRGQEMQLLRLVRLAWEDRSVVSVYFDEKVGPGGKEERWPSELVLRKP
jgi:hypothetical protein